MRTKQVIDSDLILCLLEHLRGGPSSDVVEIVADWKIMAYKIEITVPKVRAALEGLITQGLVSASFANGLCQYEIASGKESEVRRLVQRLRCQGDVPPSSAFG